MADPLGIITSTLHAAHKVYEIVKTIKDAPEEIQALQDQAHLLDSILPGISDFLQRAGESTSMSLLAAKAGELNASVERFLNKATKMSPRGERKVKKLKWWFNADEAKSLTGKLSVFYGALSASHSIESSRHIHTSFSELDVRLEESFASTNDRLSGCFTEVHTHLDTQLVGVREIFQEELAKTSEELMHALLVSRACELRTLANQQRRGEGHGFDQNSVLFNTDYVVQATSVLPDFRGQAEGSSTSTRPDYAPSTMVPGYPPPSISPLETPCKHCSCQCHRAACLLRTPKSVSSIIGDHYAKIPFPHRVWPGLVQCDVPTCKKGWLMQVKSFLPYWFARVEMQMRFEVLPVHFCIQTPRFNPEIDYKMAETVPERGADVFKELLYSRRATINDVNEHGLGLLHLAVYYIGDVADSDDRQLNNVIDAVSYLLEVGVSLEWQDVHSRCVITRFMLPVTVFTVGIIVSEPPKNKSYY
ncbi:hypothetical protein PHLCEN_2v9117 [Hermanssonia centrifuga]|uniref:Fungal N-terminal domain-containing protein n=1 Tax=Hermanssonia centrifuga TaxID=98765 RepID=A0A2R6NRR1_9APHY|nr:hypothetical protein PHLCEN_2v9117 [Hermanssonia centrifuga]